MRPLRDSGFEELQKLEMEARQRCGVCKAGDVEGGHHHHFCLQCALVLGTEEEAEHGIEWLRLSSGLVQARHTIQFCPLCAPPMEHPPSSATARHANELFRLFGDMGAAALEADRLLAIRLKWRGTERVVPKATWPPIPQTAEGFAPGMAVSVDPGLRSALQPLGLMPSSILEDHGPRVLAHPWVWRAFRSLVALASLDNSKGEVARHEIRTICAVLVGDQKPKMFLGRDFDEWLLAEYEKLLADGNSIADAISELVNVTGLSLLNLEKRISRERARTGKQRRRYVERKGPAAGRRMK